MVRGGRRRTRAGRGPGHGPRATRTRTPRAPWVVRLRGGGIGARARTRPWTIDEADPGHAAARPARGPRPRGCGIVGGAPSPLPAPAAISNGWIAFATNPSRGRDWSSGGERRDIFLTGEGVIPRRIVGSEDDRTVPGVPEVLAERDPDGLRAGGRVGPCGGAVGEGEVAGDEPRRGGGGGGPGWHAIPGGHQVQRGDGPRPAAVPRVVPRRQPPGVLHGYRAPGRRHSSPVRRPSLPVAVVQRWELRVPGWASLDFEWAPDGTAIAVAEDDQNPVDTHRRRPRDRAADRGPRLTCRACRGRSDRLRHQ